MREARKVRELAAFTAKAFGHKASVKVVSAPGSPVAFQTRISRSSKPMRLGGRKSAVSRLLLFDDNELADIPSLESIPEGNEASPAKKCKFLF